MVVTNQVHVYIIGEIAKGKTYNIINIEGFHADHMVISKGELINLIKKTVTEKLFLPDNPNRIIYMHGEVLFIFNKIGDTNKNLFSKSQWTMGTDIYDVEARQYETDANKILKAIMSEF